MEEGQRPDSCLGHDGHAGDRGEGRSGGDALTGARLLPRGSGVWPTVPSISPQLEAVSDELRPGSDLVAGKRGVGRRRPAASFRRRRRSSALTLAAPGAERAHGARVKSLWVKQLRMRRRGLCGGWHDAFARPSCAGRARDPSRRYRSATSAGARFERSTRSCCARPASAGWTKPSATSPTSPKGCSSTSASPGRSCCRSCARPSLAAMRSTRRCAASQVRLPHRGSASERCTRHRRITQVMDTLGAVPRAL